MAIGGWRNGGRDAPSAPLTSSAAPVTTAERSTDAMVTASAAAASTTAATVSPTSPPAGAATLADLSVGQATGTKGWPLLFIVPAFPIVAYDLADPGRWRWHLVAVWVAVSLYVMAASIHIGYMLAR